MSLYRPTMEWLVHGVNPSGRKIFFTCQTGPGAHPAFYIMCTGPFLGVMHLGCEVKECS